MEKQNSQCERGHPGKPTRGESGVAHCQSQGQKSTSAMKELSEAYV